MPLFDFLRPRRWTSILAAAEAPAIEPEPEPISSAGELIAGVDYPISTSPIAEPPLVSFSGWRQQQVQAAIDAFEVGAMAVPHQLYLAMLRSAIFSHGIEGRVAALVDADFEWRKPPDLPQELFDEWVLRWPDAFDENELANVTRQRIAMGVNPAQCTWTAGGTCYWLRRCHGLDTGNLSWDFALWRYHIETYDQGQQIVEDDCDPYVLFKERAATYPHLHGACRSTATDWWCGMEAERLESLYGRRCGNPIWKVSGPADVRAPTDPRQDFQHLVRLATRILGNGVFQSLIKNDGTKLYDLDFLEAKGEAHKVFDVIIDRTGMRITLKLRGAIDSTQGGRDGSRARADVHMKQENKYLGSDGRLTACILNRIAAKWCRLNRWPSSWEPKAHFDTQPPEDQRDLADVRDKYASALSKILGPDGGALDQLEARLRVQDPQARIDVRKLLQQHQVPLIEPGEQDPRTAPVEARPAPARAAKGRSVAVPAEKEEEEETLSARESGVMIAVYPDPEVAAHLALPGGEAAEDLHITLAYLGRRAEDDTLLQRLVTILDDVAARSAPLVGATGGVGRFPASQQSNGSDVMIALPDVPGLAELRAAIASALTAEGIAYASDHGWVPHLTLAYLARGAQLPVDRVPPLRMKVGQVSLVAGGTRRDFDLVGPISQA